MMPTPLQQPSVHHNPSCDECERDAEKNRVRKEQEFARQNVAKKD